ncbi:MAG: 5'/3'-nucleotidase SurE, partial [Planctomycetaceae bacterium]
QDRIPERGRLWSINFPDTTLEGPRGIKFAPMGVQRPTDRVENRLDPRGRPYYWSGLDSSQPRRVDPETDVQDLADGYVTVTPLHFDLTETGVLESCRACKWGLD